MKQSCSQGHSPLSQNQSHTQHSVTHWQGGLQRNPHNYLLAPQASQQ